MSILITIVLVLTGIIALILVVALFTKKEYVIQREIIIPASKQKVFDYVKHIKNQDHYNKWVMMDPNMKKEFKGSDGTVGFIYAWDGNKKAGQGEQEIKEITEGERISTEVRFVRPFAGVSGSQIATEYMSGNQTKVKWSFASNMKYPMNIMILFINKMLGKDMETSLSNLKAILERN